MLKWLKSLRDGHKPSPNAPTSSDSAVAAGANSGNLPAAKFTPIYPPNDPGMSVHAPQALVDSNTGILERLQLHAATSTEKYDERYLQPILRLAEHINCVPGTAAGNFSGQGGLLRACTELAFLCFQASDGRIFTGNATVEGRHKLEPRWRYVCFVAGLLYPIGKPMGRMVVTSGKGTAWTKHHCGITQWAQESGIDRIYVSWPSDVQSDKEAIGPATYTASILHKVIGPENLAWLDEGSPDLTRVLLELVSGHETNARIASDVLATMWSKVMQREQDRRPQSYGRMTVGTHLAPYLIGAMRNLVQEGKWEINRMPLIVDATGVYLVWPEAGEDLATSRASEGREGWPASAHVMAEVLKAAGIFEISKGNDIGMTEVIDANGEVLSAYMLKNPRAVVEDYEAARYKKEVPKTLAGVLAKDPLAAAEKVAENVAAVTVPAAPSPVISAAPKEAKADLVESTENDKPDIPAKQEVPAKSAPKDPGQTKQVAQVEKGRVVEVAEVRFSDLVAEDVRKDLPNPLTVELLGKVIKAWKDRGQNSDEMRMTDNGAAFSFEFLVTLVRDIPNWTSQIAEAGLVYSPPDTPGKKVQSVAFPEGAKPQNAIVISRYGCKKLGL